MIGEAESALTGGFTLLDWGVVLAILALTTIIGERLAGKQASIRDFFLGGRKLPWFAVAASIVATEISAVTYISLPSVVFKDGGNITYLQLGVIGSFIARVFIGYVLVPAYYEREIFSPYDYMGERLGSGVRSVTTLLFSLGGVLGQSARVYLTAVVLEVILHAELAQVESATGIPPLATSIIAIGVIAIAWTWIGGIATVIWTDAILFVLFLFGVGVALFTVNGHVDGGVSAALSAGYDAGKFQFLDFDTSPTKAYTFWAAIIAATWGGIGSYGTDHLMAQRIFCCKNEAEARKAIIASVGAMGVTFLVTLVGVGLWAYYRQFPLEGAALAMVTEKPDRIFPVFITEVVQPGFKGLVIAGAFAAAISSLDSILAALSQTTMSAIVLPALEKRSGAEVGSERALKASRILVIFWGVVLCAAALSMEVVNEYYDSILDLALAMASYTGGALIAGFFLSFVRGLRVDGSGYPWSAALSVMTVFSIVWHQAWARWTCVGFAIAIAVLWIARRGFGELRALLSLIVGAATVVVLSYFGTFEDGKVLAWPWYIPIGSLVAFVYGILLAKKS